MCSVEGGVGILAMRVPSRFSPCFSKASIECSISFSFFSLVVGRSTFFMVLKRVLFFFLFFETGRDLERARGCLYGSSSDSESLLSESSTGVRTSLDNVMSTKDI